MRDGSAQREPLEFAASRCHLDDTHGLVRKGLACGDVEKLEDFMDLVADRIELLDGLFSVLVGQLRTELETVESTRLNLAAVPDDV